ncbi:MAG: ketopantoate reductase family protein [Myxococcota bacterium]
MRYVIYGAGAVGGVIAARLSRAGIEVSVVARGAHLAAILDEGLRFASPNERFRVQLPAFGDPSEIDWRGDETVLMCMKSQHSQEALDALRSAAGPEVRVVCCQNGVANERMALRRFAHVYAMVVMLPASHLEPGCVIAQSKIAPGILDAGRYPQGVDDAIRGVTRDLEAATFSARPDPRVMRLKYTKLLLNLGNALWAACGPVAEGREILAAARAEALACFEAASISWASREEFRERRGDLIQPTPVEGQARGGGSSWQSLARGTGNIEADFLNGEIVLLGRLHGIATPTNEVLQQVALEVARARGRPGSFPLDALRARIERAGRSGG